MVTTISIVAWKNMCKGGGKYGLMFQRSESLYQTLGHQITMGNRIGLITRQVGEVQQEQRFGHT